LENKDKRIFKFYKEHEIKKKDGVEMEELIKVLREVYNGLEMPEHELFMKSVKIWNWL